jgi:hypothetical protein
MNDNPYLALLDAMGITSQDDQKPLYKYVKADTFKRILANNTLRFGNPAYYNDPFEFSDDCFDFNLDDETFRALYRSRLSRESEETQRKFAPLEGTFPKDLFTDIYKKRIEAYKKTALIFCTTVSPLNRLMWAHYTENHKGICFGIRIPMDTDNEKEMIVTKSVKYNPAISTHSVLSDDQIKNMTAIYNWIYTKSEIWEYEAEMRTYRLRHTDIIYDKDFILPEAVEYEDIPFEKETLLEVYYGMHTSQKDIDEIEDSITKNGYGNITRFRIQKKKGTYDIERVKI